MRDFLEAVSLGLLAGLLAVSIVQLFVGSVCN